jgi:hypothetical protein
MGQTFTSNYPNRRDIPDRGIMVWLQLYYTMSLNSVLTITHIKQTKHII